MKKWIYKLIFTIAIVPLSLFMLPKKEVKALEDEFFPVLLKTTYVSTYYDAENPETYQFVITYRLDNIYINNLEKGIFLSSKVSISFYQVLI